MKLIYAVISDDDSSRLISQLNKEGHRVTKLSSSGGFLRSGNTTLMIGTDEDKVDSILQVIKEYSCSRKVAINANMTPSGMAGTYIPYPVEVLVGGATVFVVDVERFEKF